MNSPSDASQDRASQLRAVLGVDGHHRKPGRFWRSGLIAMAGMGVVAAAVYWQNSGSNGDITYRTEPAALGKLVVTVSATGNLQPTNKVDVGSELSGIVDAVFVEENDRVRKGQLLVRLDLSRLNDAVAAARANLALAKAQVLQAQATVAETRANLQRLQDLHKLSGGREPSRADLAAADANLKRADAAEASANASVTLAQANLQSSETSLAKASIRSPIDGIVLTRAVEPGQTMAASFEAPVLFTLAEDLAKMELEVAVDEADVGQVAVGQAAVFTVDAWPGREYPAVITSVGYGSQSVDGVISYPATLQVENTDLSLRPGMTATAEITTLVKEQTLLVSNAALRFAPADPAATPAKKSRGLLGSLLIRPPQNVVVKPKDEAKPGERQLWVLQDGQPLALNVTVGASSGRQTEVTGGDLRPGMEVILEATSNAPKAGTR